MNVQDRTAAGRAGARNLLQGCAGLAADAEVLIVGEDNAAPFFDPQVCHAVASEAQALGLKPDVRLVDATAGQIPEAIAARMREVAATIFLSRLGGRARFAVPEAPGVVINAYPQTLAHLGDPFCTVDYAVQRAVHDALVERIAGAKAYRITAPCGTDLSAPVPPQRAAALTGFALEIFPLMIFPPVMCPELEGRLVIDHFVTSSATRQFDDSILMLDTPLQARLETGRIVDISGPAEPVARLTDLMQRAAALTGGDPMRVNSWHTGINPNTFTDIPARQDPDRWGAIAFGAPRYTHFHASGHDPGDVAFSLFDATIAFDGVPFWEEGRFVFLDLPEVQALIPDDARAVLSSDVMREIGI